MFLLTLGYSRKNPNQIGWVEDMEFPGVLKKDNVEIPWVMVFCLGIFKESNTISQNFQG